MSASLKQHWTSCFRTVVRVRVGQSTDNYNIKIKYKSMLNIIITNQVLIKICKYLVKLFKFLNKYLFILSLISLLNKIYAKFKENKFYYAINWTIKIILICHVQ